MSDDRLEDDVQFALDVARKASRAVDDLQEELDTERAHRERLERKVEALEDALDESYAALSKPQKVAKVRQHAIERAEAKSTNRHALDYDDVVWGVFDGQPSTGHAYNLITAAADHDAFEELDNPKRVAVDLDRLNAQATDSVVNNGRGEVDG